MSGPAEPGPEPGEEDSVGSAVPIDRVRDVGVTAGHDVRISGEIAAGRDVTIESLYLVTRSTAPFNAPPDVTDFVDRTSEFDELVARLTGGGRNPRVSLYGQGGVGKTALGTHLLHHLRDRFPDGVLFAQLSTEGGRAPDTASILSDFLYLLRVPSEATNEQRLVAAYRSAVIDRSLLVMLDNAQDPHQVAQLLPTSGNSATIVTSRTPMTSIEGAELVRLDVLSRSDSARLVGLLARLEDPDDGAAADVGDLCGRLPLALRVAGAKLRTRSDLTLESLRSRLSDQKGRLDVLRSGHAEVRASLMLSYLDLDADEQHAFRMLGLSAAEELPSWILAPLIGVTPARSATILDRLFDAQLVTVSRDDGTGLPLYRMHDLLRVLAGELLDRDESADERDRAALRLHRAYLGTVRVASRSLRRLGSGRTEARTTASGDDVDHAEPADSVARESLDEIARAPMNWFVVNRHGLLASVRDAVDRRADELVDEFEAALQPLLILSPFLEDRLLVHRLAVQAGRVGGDPERLARSLVDLGRAERDIGDGESASASLDEGIGILRELPGSEFLPHAVIVRAVLHAYVGRTADAETAALECLRTFGERGDTASEAYALRTLAAVYRAQFRWNEADDALSRGGDLFEQVGDRHRLAIVLVQQASVLRHRGRPGESFPLLERAAAIFTELNFPLWLTIARLHRAACLADLGAATEARSLLDDCLVEFAQVGEHRWGLIGRYHRARIDVVTGDRQVVEPRTVSELREVTAEFDALGDVFSTAVAGWALARTLRGDRQDSAARRAAERALTHADALGNETLAQEIREFLDGVE